MMLMMMMMIMIQLRFGRVVVNLCELSDRVYPEDACGSGKEIKGNVAMIWHTFAVCWLLLCVLSEYDGYVLMK